MGMMPKWAIAFRMWDAIVQYDPRFIEVVELRFSASQKVVLYSLVTWYRSNYDYQELSSVS